nr:hypothetical protein [Tanacetum cinerariifolium]
MLNKENYVPWSSRLLWYAKSRPNGKLIHNSILNGPYVRRMILEPGDTNREVTVTETFHVQIDNELFDKELKQIEADDQAIQTILLGLPEDIYEKKAKLFNEWERFTSNERESIESYYHHFLKLMNDLKRNKHFPEKIASNLKFLNNLQPEWSRHVTIVHQTKDLHTADYTQLYDFLKYNQKEVDELKAERLAKTQDPLALMANSNNPYNAGNLTGYNDVQNIGNQNQIGNDNLVAARAKGNTVGQNGNQIRCYNCRGVGHYARNCTVRPKRRDAAYLQTQLLIAQKEEAGIQLQAEEYDLMAAVADLEEIEEVNANCILMANLQQASTLGTQTDSAPVYDSDGSAENLAIEVEKVNSINRKLKETNADLTTELARFKNQTRRDTATCSKSREKMKQLNKEIKPANCTKINHLSEVFVPQMAMSREELYFSNNSKTANVSKSISIPNDDFSDDNTPSVARKFLNEVKSTIVTLQRVVKHRMTIETQNWSSSAHQELHKIKLENENVELEFQVLNYARENAHLKATYKNLFDSISVSRTQTKTIIASLQNELQTTNRGKLPIVSETNALSKSVTLNSVSTPQEPRVVKNDKVIASGMFRINPDKTSRGEKKVPNSVRTSNRTKPITVSQPPVITKKDVNSDVNGLSSTGVDNTKTRRPQPKSNTKNDRVPSASKSIRSKNKEAEVEEHHRNLLPSKNNKHMSSACNNIKLDSQDVISKVVCAMCKQCLISVNHDACLRNYVNGKNSRGKKQMAKVSVKEIQKKYQPKVTNPKKVGIPERLATPKPRNPRFLLRWSPTGKLFDQEGKPVASSESKSQSDCSNGDNACTSNTLEPKIKRFPNSTSFLDRSKDEAPEVIKTFLKRITVLLQSPVIIIRTDNGTEFKNQVLKEYFDSIGISHQMSSVRTPQQNGVVERRNRIKLDISFLHVFGALCYPKNDREDIGKLGTKGDIGFFIGYSADSCAYRIYNRRTKKIMETMNVSFDEFSTMAFEQRSSKPGLQSMTSGQISLGLDLTYALSTITTQQPTEGELDLLFEAMYDDYIGGQPSATARTVPPAQEPQVRQMSTASTTIVDTTPNPTNLSSHATIIPITLQDVDELNSNTMVDGNTFINPFANSSTSVAESSSSQNVDPSNMHTFYQPYPQI